MGSSSPWEGAIFEGAAPLTEKHREFLYRVCNKTDHSILNNGTTAVYNALDRSLSHCIAHLQKNPHLRCGILSKNFLITCFCCCYTIIPCFVTDSSVFSSTLLMISMTSLFIRNCAQLSGFLLAYLQLKRGYPATHHVLEYINVVR